MSRKKNSNIYVIVFSIVGIASIVLLKKQIEDQYFYRFNFDLNEKRIIEINGSFEVESVDYDGLVLKKIVKKPATFIPKDIYEVIFLKTGKNYFFTFEKIDENSNRIKIDQLIWLFRKPLEKKGNVKIQKVQIPFETKGDTRVAMITGEFGCCIMWGKRLRYLWNSINDDITFVGGEKDIYGYNYVNYEGINSKNIIKNVSIIPDANIYVIWLGRNEPPNISPEEIVSNIKKLVELLHQRNAENKVAILTPAPITADNQNKKITEIRGLLNNLMLENVEVIDIYDLIVKSENWKENMYFGGYALNSEAYQRIINYVDKKIWK